MDFKQLRYFTLVANVGSITQASTHLGVAAPAISRSVASLERELGCRLFERDGRGMRLTEVGKRLHADASRILRDLEASRQAILADGQQYAGEVVIGATPAAAALVGAGLVERVGELAPRVRPRVLEGYSGYLRHFVLTGTVDFALTNGNEPGDAQLTCERLASERLVAVGQPDWGADPVSLAAILDGPLVLPSATNPTRALVDTAARGLRRQVTTRLDVDSATLLKDLAASGYGVAVLPHAAVAREVREGRLSARPIVEPEIVCDLNLVFRRDNPPAKVAALLVRVITEVLAEAAETEAPSLRMTLYPPETFQTRTLKSALPKR